LFEHDRYPDDLVIVSMVPLQQSAATQAVDLIKVWNKTLHAANMKQYFFCRAPYLAPQA
jgi:hypothetical protein